MYGGMEIGIILVLNMDKLILSQELIKFYFILEKDVVMVDNKYNLVKMVEDL